MNTVTTFGNFRNNLNDYIDLMKKGAAVSIKDGRKDENIVTLVAKKEEGFDWGEYMKFIESIKGSGLLASKSDEKARIKFRSDLDKNFRKR